MENKKLFFVLILIPIILVFSSIQSENPNHSENLSPADSSVLPSRGFFMGILPNAPSESEIEETYEEISQHAEFVPIWSSGTGASGFWDYSDKLEGWWGQTFLEEYIRGNEMFPIVNFSFMDKEQGSGQLILKTPENMQNATLEDNNWRSLYKKSVVEIVKTVKPLYLSTGNEVNRWYEEHGAIEGDPNGFQHLVSLHEEIYEEVKKISPETRVFCTFSREIVGQNRPADLDVLNNFDPNTLDILAFTSYPFALPQINDPIEIPENYYLVASQYMPEKPFGFSEVGWPSKEFYGGEEGQAKFLEEVSGRLTTDQGIDLHLLGYLWLYDASKNDSTGLIKRNGTGKLAYQKWIQISNSD